MTIIKRCDNCGSIDSIKDGIMLGVTIAFGYPSKHDNLAGNEPYHFCDEDCLKAWLDKEEKNNGK